MRAPPASNRPTMGARAFMAMSWIFTIFCACVSDSEPPSTVKSLANTKTVRPFTVPQPVTTPSPGILACLSMPKSTQRCSTNMSNSSNEPLSIRRSMRSRAVSLPRLCCASMRALPPPSRAWLRRVSSFSRMSFMAFAPGGPACPSSLLSRRDRGVQPAAGDADQEGQDLGDRLVELERDLVADLDLGERGRERGILLDRHAVRPGGLDDLLADRAGALGDHPRPSRLLIMERDGERFLRRGHEARSRKRPEAAASRGRGGAPWRTSTSPGSISAARSASA